MEVAFTGLYGLIEANDRSLTGHTYVWMFPIYAIVPLYFAHARRPLRRVLLPARLVVHVACLLAGELLAGLALRALLGECPWEPAYRGSEWALLGLTRLDYAPAWAVAVLGFERLYDILHPEAPSAATGGR